MKLPPYGKPLHELLLSNKKPDNSVYCYIGQGSWEKGKVSSISRPTRTLALPPNHSPFSYLWPVHGCEILLIETSELVTEYIEDIVRVLFAHQAHRIVCLSSEFLSTTYEKDF